MLRAMYQTDRQWQL